MEEFIHDETLKSFRARLAEAADEKQRRTLRTLIKEEEAKTLRRVIPMLEHRNKRRSRNVNPGADTWYVAFRRPNEVPGVNVRNSRTFQTELEARQFARECFAEGCDLTAGTINPYRPKKTIGQYQLLGWLEIDK